MSKMLTVVWRGQGRENLNIEEIDIPKVGPEEVLIKVKSVLFGALHTRAVLKGHATLQAPDFGFEGRMLAGDIVEVGSQIKNLKPGLRVTVNPEAPCGKCFYCLKDEPVHCRNMKKLSPGGMSQYVLVSKELVPGIFEFPEGVLYEHAAYTETLACTLYSTLKAKITFGSRVAIIGAGNVGLVHLQLAKIRGATHVFVIDVDAQALETLKGVDRVYPIHSATQDPVAVVRELTEGRGADVAIEAVGRAETYKLALELVRRGGTVMGFGGCPPGASFACDPNLIHYRSINFLGTYHYTPELFKQALNLTSSGAIDLTPVITHRLPMSQIHEAVDLYLKPEVKILVLDPWS